jgi:hypothetical protein
MKQAGQYEMQMMHSELEALLLQLTPVLLTFDAEEVAHQKKAANDLLWNSTDDWDDLTLFHDADAEVSIFNLYIESYRAGGERAEMFSKPGIDRSWRGLRFDARDYPGIDSIQDLMQAERTLRGFTQRSELVRVESLQ